MLCCLFHYCGFLSSFGINTWLFLVVDFNFPIELLNIHSYIFIFMITLMFALYSYNLQYTIKQHSRTSSAIQETYLYTSIFLLLHFDIVCIHFTSKYIIKCTMYLCYLFKQQTFYRNFKIQENFIFLIYFYFYYLSYLALFNPLPRSRFLLLPFVFSLSNLLYHILNAALMGKKYISVFLKKTLFYFLFCRWFSFDAKSQFDSFVSTLKRCTLM